MCDCPPTNFSNKLLDLWIENQQECNIGQRSCCNQSHSLMRLKDLNLRPPSILHPHTLPPLYHQPQTCGTPPFLAAVRRQAWQTQVRQVPNDHESPDCHSQTKPQSQPPPSSSTTQHLCTAGLSNGFSCPRTTCTCWSPAMLTTLHAFNVVFSTL